MSDDGVDCVSMQRNGIWQGDHEGWDGVWTVAGSTEYQHLRLSAS